MINWRDGKAGFVGAAKHWIKGFFRYAYSETTESIASPDAYHSLISPIVTTGNGVLSTITATHGILSTVTASHGLSSMLNARGRGLESTTTDAGTGLESAIENTS